MLGIEYFDESLTSVSGKKLEKLRKIFNAANIQCYIADDTPF